MPAQGAEFHAKVIAYHEARKEAAAIEEVSARLTAAQLRGALEILESVQTGRRAYPDVTALAVAIATAVVAAEDDTARYTVVTPESQELGVAYGPMTKGAADKFTTGLDPKEYRRLRVVPTPRNSQVTKIAAPKKKPPTRKRETA